MNSSLDKTKTYIGFAIKSRKIKFGVDDILKLKNCSLILVSSELAESGLNKLVRFAENNSIPLEKLNVDDFQYLVNNDSIKATAILDENLAEAIKKNLTI